MSEPTHTTDLASEAWTSREVTFEPFSDSVPGLDALMDAACDHYWKRRQVLGIAVSGGVMLVDGWPWWVPAWWARRSVVNLAARLNVCGEARFRVTRVLLPRRSWDGGADV